MEPAQKAWHQGIACVICEELITKQAKISDEPQSTVSILAKRPGVESDCQPSNVKKSLPLNGLGVSSAREGRPDDM
jgi:hypothetical protein